MAIHQTDEFTLGATGDSVITREILSYEGASPQFDQLLDHLRDADVTVTNLETLLHDYQHYPMAISGGTYMRSPPKVADELVKMGCDMFSAATNHSFDFGHGGIETTIDELTKRNIPFAGLGRNLYEARRPAYLETPAGRVALLSTCSTITPGSEAGEQTAALSGRPGLNPLRTERVFKIDDEQLEILETISQHAGIEALKKAWRNRSLKIAHDWDNENYFHFMDLKFKSVDDPVNAGIDYNVNDADRTTFFEWVQEANKNADLVLVSLHAHEGTDGHFLRGTKTTPDFIKKFARDCIDEGADAFLGTGPHVLRGIEIYNRRPIFYSLGNFIMQNETVERLPAESYGRYRHQDYTKVSQVFRSRLYDDDGNPKGDLANEGFWESVVPVCTFSESGLNTVNLYPCTLQQKQERTKRGIPVAATGEKAQQILENIDCLSEPFGTEIQIKDETGTIDL